MTAHSDNVAIPQQIYRAVKTSNVWDLRKIFRGIDTEKKTRFLNEYWITEEGHRGFTFLHLSVYSDVTVAQYLLSEGAHPNQYNLDDNTPLHLATLQNRGIIIRLLIKFGADPSIRNVDGKTCHDVCSHSNRARKTSVLIQKCLAEQETLSQLKSLPFQDPEDQHLKEIVSTLSDDSIIDDVLDFIVSTMDQQHFEALNCSSADSSPPDPETGAPIAAAVPALNVDESSGGNAESGVNRQDFVNEWSTEFSNANITTFAQLSLPAFEDWPILVAVPAVVVYGMERVLEAKSSSLMEEIKLFCPTSKVMDVIEVANHWLKNKFDGREKEFEAILLECGCYTLSHLQSMTSRKWRMLKIDLIFSDTVRKIINLYNLHSETSQRADARKKRKSTRKKKESSCLVSGQSTVCCVAVDDIMIHIAFMDGTLRAFEFEIFDSFHSFKLMDDEHKVHVPLWMQFVNDTNHHELVTADDRGSVCCWFLHSSHPNERAKCVRRWNTHCATISGLAMPRRSEMLYTIGFDGYLRVRNLGYNGKIVHSVQHCNVALTALSLLNEHCSLIGTENGTIMEVDIRRESISNVFRLRDESPIRALCVDDEHGHCYFSFGAHSIGVLDIGNSGEWQFLGTFTEGFEHHQGAVNDLRLRNGYLWSSSEDNTIRVWDLSFLRENLENAAKKKGKNAASMPRSMTLADSQCLSANSGGSTSENASNLLEVWSSLKLSGKWKNGIQRVHFNEKAAMMIAIAYQRDLVVYDLERIDNLLPQKQQMIEERRKQLNDYEKELESVLQKGSEPKEVKADKKKGKKKK